MSEAPSIRFFPGVFPAVERRRNEVIAANVVVGDRFGRWLITGVSSTRKRYYSAICECGVQREIYRGQLIRGNTMSCGCFGRELSSHRRKGLPSPNAGRVIGDEERQKVSEQSKERWANGCFDTPAVREARQRMIEAQAGTPETGANVKGPANHSAKFWRLVSPAGNVLEGFNLDHLIRENADLFSADDVKFKRNEFGTETTCRAYGQLQRVGNGERASWKGWRRA